MIFEAVWYNGWDEPPGYFLLDEAEGDTAEEALVQNVGRLTQQVREMFSLDDWSDSKIQETLYVFPSDALISLRSIQRARELRELDQRREN